ncbi:hypothetical protein E5082_30155 [Streptomyces griseoluteus]|uniref:Uncharacterized protein n=1 Tax=Streptomyces griseoluteus TaxID=29306 RepID=A0A4Z1CZ37_STRGP|nr:hypothetical protein [Streptomyces griseoluteus]TGN74369.1 hypothetical protein E5082_30155 [Streptomyces griseoluteus]
MPLNAQALNTATFAELLADTHRTAVHLEMRDVYAVGDETEDSETGARRPPTEALNPATPVAHPPSEALSHTSCA